MCKAWIMLNENCFCYINTYWVLSMACDDKNYYVPQLEFFLTLHSDGTNLKLCTSWTIYSIHINDVLVLSVFQKQDLSDF
jgi:hypothetical protein